MKRLILLAAILSGCATNGNPQDPLESFNRGVYRFNDTLDKAVLKPVAQGYDRALPQPVQTGVANFFSNLGDVIVVVNDLLQFKIAQGVSDAGRLAINSTIGILGFIDVASDIGLPKHNEDFGQTLGYWGMATGAYLVLPFFGPSNVRDAGGLAVDIVTYPVYYVNDWAVRSTLYGTNTISDRDQLLQAEKVLDRAALDQYQFVRDAYLQRRRNLVHDGNAPKEEYDEGVEGKRAPNRPSAEPESIEEPSSTPGRDPADDVSLATPAALPNEPRPPASRVWLPKIPKNLNSEVQPLE